MMVERVYWDIAKVWCYDPDTSEFTMELNCDPHPAYPDQYLKPDFCLLVPPLEVGQYQTNMMKDGNWIVVCDYKNIPLYNKLTKEVTIYTEINIDCPNTHTTIKPISNESYIVWKDTAWIEDVNLKLEYNKSLKIAECKQKANEIIIAKYPEWLQINLSADREFALGYISKFKSKPNDEINNEIVDKLMGLSIDKLKEIRNNFSVEPTIDINDLLVGMPSPYIDSIKTQYFNIANGYIAYVLVKFVRIWCNQKVDAINECTTQIQLNNISFDDCIEL